MKTFASKFLFLISLFLISCESDLNVDTSIPQMPVYFNLSLMKDAPELIGIGACKTFIQPIHISDAMGYGGIIIYHNVNDGYYAYDAACPYECDKNIRVVPDASGIAVCPKCSSKFDIGFGSGTPSKGPAKYNLRIYQVIRRGDILTVTN